MYCEKMPSAALATNLRYFLPQSPVWLNKDKVTEMQSSEKKLLKQDRGLVSLTASGSVQYSRTKLGLKLIQGRQMLGETQKG